MIGQQRVPRTGNWHAGSRQGGGEVHHTGPRHTGGQLKFTVGRLVENEDGEDYFQGAEPTLVMKITATEARELPTADPTQANLPLHQSPPPNQRRGPDSVVR